MGKFHRFLQRVSRRYTQYVDKHGLGLIIAACIATVAGSAAWTYATLPRTPSAPVFPVEEALSAAELLQQSLAEVSLPTAAPTAVPPVVYSPPVSSPVVINPFDAARLQQSPVTGIWSLHDAVDIAVTAGEQVLSISDGVVSSVESNDLHGVCVTIDHGDGITACYMGLKAAAGLKAGDPVSIGQTLGFAGSCMKDETTQPHLHLRVLRYGEAIDPLSLWQTDPE